MTAPIPQCLAHRPTAGGLVVPYISVSDGVHHILGNVHRTRALSCIRDRLCQICGRPLGRRLVVFVDQGGLDKRYTAEPALHPQCAAYSAQACPMLAGQLDRYRRSPAPLERVECFEPGCGCGGWTDSPGVEVRERGAPAGPWFAVWLPDYEVAVKQVPEGLSIHGLAWQTIEPLRIRPVAVRAGE